MQTIVYILPEIFLSLAIMFLLMLGVFVKKSFKLVNLLTALCLIFTIALISMKYVRSPMYLFFKFDSGMLDYLNGTKPKDMNEPYLSYIYMEKRLQIRIKQVQDS